MPIAREGWWYIGALGALGVLFCAARMVPVGSVLLVLSVFTAFFFRDPERVSAEDSRFILSPADGRIVQVRESSDVDLGGPATQVSIFLSIFNVHVNRAPIAGRVAGVWYKKGVFLPAFKENASLQNEQNKVLIEGEGKLAFTQIAGLIARRIVFRKRVDDTVARGERVGLIKFGSRVDVFLPKDVKVLVKVGDRVKGGLSPIGERS